MSEKMEFHGAVSVKYDEDGKAYHRPPQPGRDTAIEECAKWHEERAALEINSLHCGDNSATIAGAHHVAAFHRFSARELRALIGKKD